MYKCFMSFLFFTFSLFFLVNNLFALNDNAKMNSLNRYKTIADCNQIKCCHIDEVENYCREINPLLNIGFLALWITSVYCLTKYRSSTPGDIIDNFANLFLPSFVTWHGIKNIISSLMHIGNVKSIGDCQFHRKYKLREYQSAKWCGSYALFEVGAIVYSMSATSEFNKNFSSIILGSFALLDFLNNYPAGHVE